MAEQVCQAKLVERFIALAVLAFEIANEAAEIAVPMGEMKQLVQLARIRWPRRILSGPSVRIDELPGYWAQTQYACPSH